MLTKAVVLVLLVFYKGIDALHCRQCNGATSIMSCTQSIVCSDDEECYMDKYVTNQHASLYYGGCRASSTCQAGAVPHLPAGIQSVSCSQCCDVNVTSGIECNVNLCGIGTTAGKALQCYYCDSRSGSSVGDVTDPVSCTGVTTCQADEICGLQESASFSGQSVYRYACQNARMCALLTKVALEEIKRCRDPAAIASGMCGNKKRSFQTVCNSCCGDNMCNYGTCYELRDRLYDMWINGTLNINTLKEISSASTGTIVG